jgi:hypothetical protein
VKGLAAIAALIVSATFSDFVGAAKFAPGGKGEMAVPTSRAFKECSYTGSSQFLWTSS